MSGVQPPQFLWFKSRSPLRDRRKKSRELLYWSCGPQLASADSCCHLALKPTWEFLPAPAQPAPGRRITECFRKDGTLKATLFYPPCHGGNTPPTKTLKRSFLSDLLLEALCQEPFGSPSDVSLLPRCGTGDSHTYSRWHPAMPQPLSPLDALLHHLVLPDRRGCVQVQGHVQLLPAQHGPHPVPHGEAAAQQLRLAGLVAQLRHPALRSQTRAQHSAADPCFPYNYSSKLPLA